MSCARSVSKRMTDGAISSTLPWYLSKYTSLRGFMEPILTDELVRGVDLGILQEDIMFAIRHSRLMPNTAPAGVRDGYFHVTSTNLVHH